MFSDAASRISRLKTLNNMLITDAERRGAEYDLLKIYGPKMVQTKDAVEKQNLFKECRALSVLFKSMAKIVAVVGGFRINFPAFSFQNMDHQTNYSHPLPRCRMLSTLKFKLFRSPKPSRNVYPVKLQFKHYKASFWSYLIRDAVNSRDSVMLIRKIRTFVWNWTRFPKI